jgi:hypothetical protein
MGRWAILNSILGLIVILLVVQVVWTWTRTLPPVEVSTRGPSPAPPSEARRGERGERGKHSKRGGTDRDVPPAVMVATIVNKDLFDPSRQKATTEEPVVEVPKETGPPPNLSLVGVRILGKDREAFLVDSGKGNDQQRLREGDEIGGFTLKTIEARRVTLGNASGEVINLTLTVETGPASKGPTAIPRAGRMPTPPGGASPAAGPQGSSPAAGVVPTASTAPTGVGIRPPIVRRPGMNPQIPQLPAGVREKLEQLKRKK